MSFLDSSLVDQKLNKYHEIIEREKAETSNYLITPRAKPNTQYNSNTETHSNFTANLSKNINANQTAQYLNMAPYSQNDDLIFYSPQSQRQTKSFISSGRSKSPGSFNSINNDKTDKLFKKSVQVITKIERYTRSSSSSRTQSPSSARSQKKMSSSDSPSSLPKSTANINSDQEEDRDLQISDLENSPNNPLNSDNSNLPAKNNNQRNNKDIMDIRDATSPLKALKRGLSSIFVSQFHKKSNNNDNDEDDIYRSTEIRTLNNTSTRSRSLTNSNISHFGSPLSSAKFEQSNWMKVPKHHSPNFIISDGSNDSPTQRYYNSRSSSASHSPIIKNFSEIHQRDTGIYPTKNTYLPPRDENKIVPLSPSNKSRSPTSSGFRTKKSNNKSTINDTIQLSDSDSNSSDNNIFNLNFYNFNIQWRIYLKDLKSAFI